MDKEKIVKLINTYWRFDNDQDHISTWHDKQDLISAIEQLTIPVVVNNEAIECNNILSDHVSDPPLCEKYVTKEN